MAFDWLLNRLNLMVLNPERAPAAQDSPSLHPVLGHPIYPPFPAQLEMLDFGMGCFWGAERRFWQQAGVWSTAVGYAAGETGHPDYKSVCTGKTGYAEVVRVCFDPELTPIDNLLKVFWESHDPTQGMRQGNDLGTQYRSFIGTHTEAHHQAALASCNRYADILKHRNHAPITTQIARDAVFYYAEPYHQQYLWHHPDGYCGLKGTGIAYECTTE